MLYIVIPENLKFEQREMPRIQEESLKHDYLVYSLEDGSSFDLDLQLLVKDCNQHRRPGIRVVNFCPLFVFKQLPSSSSPYLQTYIYLQNAEELYYVKANGEFAQEKLQDYEPLNQGLDSLKPESSLERGTYFQLNSKHIQGWIRDQGGSTPITRAEVAVYFREKDIPKGHPGQLLYYEPNDNGKNAANLAKCRFGNVRDIERPIVLPRPAFGALWSDVARNAGVISQEKYEEARAVAWEQRENCRHTGDCPKAT